MKLIRIIFILLMSVAGLMSAQTIAPKKCNTCGKPLAQCQYKGKHPSTMKPEKKEKTPQIVVSFGCITNSAMIFIDGKNYGSINNKIMLNYGKHSIKVTCDGYKNYEGSITVDSNNYYFYVRLEKLQQLISVPEKTMPEKGIANGHEWVDLGLSSGTKWATMNVDASSPSDYGSYFAWGETKPKSSYDSSTQIYRRAEKIRELDLSHDPAYVNWGTSWRMPSKEQLDELQRKCKWIWTTMGGHNGYRVVGPNGNSIFLPASGYGTGSRFLCVGTHAYYWSRTLSFSDAKCLVFNSSNIWLQSFAIILGLNVRPVLAS